MKYRIFTTFFFSLSISACRWGNKNNDTLMINPEIIQEEDINNAIYDKSDSTSMWEFSLFIDLRKERDIIIPTNKNISQLQENEILDLLNQSINIIPDTTTLGGTFIFHKIKKINDELILANYEDGHKGGYLLIQIDKNVEKRSLNLRPIKVRKY